MRINEQPKKNKYYHMVNMLTCLFVASLFSITLDHNKTRTPQARNWM